MIFTYGALRLAAPSPLSPAAPLVRVVQADVPQEAFAGDAAKFQEIVGRYLRLTARPASPPGAVPDIVIWPEGAHPRRCQRHLRHVLLDPAGDHRRPAAGPDPLDGRPSASGARRPSITTQPDRPAPPDPHGLFPSIAVYDDKFRLVPFGEYLPLDGLLSRLGVKKLVHVGDGFSSGPPPRPIASPGIPPVQPLICYESLFPGFVREGARLGGRAAWIVNVSNDAWFGFTSGPLQHLNMASYRAIEEGLPIVRATPTGVSAVIDAYGRIRPGERLGLGAQGVIDARLPPPLPPTPFSRWGETAFWLMMLASLFGLGDRCAVRMRAATRLRT